MTASMVSVSELLVAADHLMFGIHDEAGAEPRDWELPRGGDWLGINPREVLVATGQERIDHELRVELWTEPPPPPEAGYEVTRTIALELPTGRMAINQLTRGFLRDSFRIPPGLYWLRLTAWERERVKGLFWEIGRRTGFREDNREFSALVDGAYGRERYLAQFWPRDEAEVADG